MEVKPEWKYLYTIPKKIKANKFIGLKNVVIFTKEVARMQSSTTFVHPSTFSNIVGYTVSVFSRKYSGKLTAGLRCAVFRTEQVLRHLEPFLFRDFKKPNPRFSNFIMITVLVLLAL